MHETLNELRNAINHDRPVAYCRLVATRGSTPQKAGAVMLVYPDGTQAGTLGGGCVEAEVKRHALTIMTSGNAEICSFQLDHDYGWDDGLICGGSMQILVDPVTNAEASDYYLQLAQLADQANGMTEAIVFDSDQSSLPSPVSFLFDAQDQCVASLRSVIATHRDVVDSLKSIQTRPRAYAAKGTAYLTSLPRCPLLIVGGGHVGKAVADLAADLDFDVWVLDDRESIVSQARFPKAKKRIAGKLNQVLREIEISADTYCMIVTRGHNHDQKALYYLADRGARYVGMIGSRRKIKMIFEDLIAEGISHDVLSQVHAPVGLDIGSQTVPEIAISIVAELIAHRNLAGQLPARPDSVMNASSS